MLGGTRSIEWWHCWWPTVTPKSSLIYGGQDRTNLFAAVKGDKLTVRFLAKWLLKIFLWIYYYFLVNCVKYKPIHVIYLLRWKISYVLCLFSRVSHHVCGYFSIQTLVVFPLHWRVRVSTKQRLLVCSGTRKVWNCCVVLVCTTVPNTDICWSAYNYYYYH